MNFIKYHQLTNKKLRLISFTQPLRFLWIAESHSLACFDFTNFPEYRVLFFKMPVAMEAISHSSHFCVHISPENRNIHIHLGKFIIILNQFSIKEAIGINIIWNYYDIMIYMKLLECDATQI